MPHRLVCVGILLFWLIAASALVTRDLLPELLIGSPPDLRSISLAEQSAKPTHWSILVAEDPALLNLRTVGNAVTESSLKKDGWVEMSSRVLIEGNDLLRGTPFETPGGDNERLEVISNNQIDPSGNLYSFRASVRSSSLPGELIVLEGRLKNNALEVRCKGPIAILNWTRSFPYQARGMVQNTLGPMDRMPGLQVGQRWESRMVSPLTGRVETVRVEVTRKGVLTWGNNPVSALEVVARATPTSVRIWVRPDGLVLRQEVPLPFLGRLVLERQPEHAGGESARVSAP